ncbi:MAG: hypothetical protein JNG89_10720 [Planctomycetaceae bacterium]|nr:hypothetical protein [Planctomycetaceae bacterium]
MVILKLGGSLLTLPDLAARITAVLAQRSDCRCALVVGGGAAADLVREWDRTQQLGDEAAHQLALCAMRFTAEFVAALLPDARLVGDRASLASAWDCGQLPLLAADAWLSRAEQYSSLSPASSVDQSAGSIGGEGWGEGNEQSVDAVPSSGLRPPSPRDLVDMRTDARCGEKGANEGGLECALQGFTVPHTWDATSDSISAWFSEELNATELVLLKSVSRPLGNAANAARDGLVDRCFPDAAVRLARVSWVNVRSEDCGIEPWIKPQPDA